MFGFSCIFVKQNNRIMTEKELLERGFIFQSKGEMENGEYFKWWKLKIRDIDLIFTVEYTDKGDEITSYWEVNDQTLKNPTKDDILNLIRILNN